MSPPAVARRPPLLPGFRLRRAILRRLDVGAGAHTRPELAGGPEVRADVGIGPYRGLLRQAPPGQNAPRGGACPRPRAAIKAAPTSGVPSSAGYLAALGRRGGCPHPPGAGRWPRRGPMWASAPTEVCCGRHRPAKMLRRGGACPHPRAATRAAPTSGVLSPAGYLAALGRRCGPMRASAPQRSAAAGTARPKCSVGEGLVPARGRPQGPPLLPGFRRWRAILRCSKHVGAGAHTRPQAVRQDKAPASGGTPCAGVLLSPEEVIEWQIIHSTITCTSGSRRTASPHRLQRVFFFGH